MIFFGVSKKSSSPAEHYAVILYFILSPSIIFGIVVKQRLNCL